MTARQIVAIGDSDAGISAALRAREVDPTTAASLTTSPGRLGQGAIAVDQAMRTNLPDIFAAGDCVHTHHRLLGITWLPLGTTALTA